MPTAHLACLSLHDNISFKGNQEAENLTCCVDLDIYGFTGTIGEKKVSQYRWFVKKAKITSVVQAWQ